MTELRPCPFCNGNAKWDKDWQAVVCTNCGASTRHSILVTRKKKEAVEAWNRRAVLEEISGKEGKISPVWHTGTPTEDGWYLVAYKKRDCDGTYYWEYGARYWMEIIEGEGHWNVCEEKHPVLAWQKIEPYKEASE